MEELKATGDPVLLLHQNGNTYDFPLQYHSMQRAGMNAYECFAGANVVGMIDTLEMARLYVQWDDDEQPTNKKLGTLFEFLTGRPLEGAHDALVDTDALIAVICSKPFLRGMALHLDEIAVSLPQMCARCRIRFVARGRATPQDNTVDDILATLACWASSAAVGAELAFDYLKPVSDRQGALFRRVVHEEAKTLQIKTKTVGKLPDPNHPPDSPDLAPLVGGYVIVTNSPRTA